MNHSILAPLVLTVVWLAQSPLAGAQAPAIPENSQVDIAYVEPINVDHRPIYDRLKKRGVLEELKQFLAPLRLPRKLLVKIEDCGTDNHAGSRYRDSIVTACYEYIANIRRLAPKD